MILIYYDGSPDSKSAIEHVGKLLRGQPATVLTVLGAVHRGDDMSLTRLWHAAGTLNIEEIDAANQRSPTRSSAKPTRSAPARS